MIVVVLQVCVFHVLVCCLVFMYWMSIFVICFRCIGVCGDTLCFGFGVCHVLCVCVWLLLCVSLL